jgi:hypothetical protein
MRTTWALAAVLFGSVLVQAQQVAPLPPAELPQAPQAPPAPVPQGQQPVPAAVTPALPLNSRVFRGQAGLIFTAVRPERVVDFETVMTYLQEALRTTADAVVRQQWQGLKILKQTEPGPNSTVLYVWLIDPVVPGADYSIGPILNAAYPDKITEIWNLYTGAYVQQSVSDLTAFVPPALPPSAQPVPAERGGPPPAGAPPTPGVPGR